MVGIGDGFRLEARRRSSGLMMRTADPDANSDEEAQGQDAAAGDEQATTRGIGFVGAIKRRSRSMKSWGGRGFGSKQEARTSLRGEGRGSKRKNLSVRFADEAPAGDADGAASTAGASSEGAFSLSALLVGSPNRDGLLEAEDESPRSEVGDYLREMFSSDASSMMSSEDPDTSFLFEPSTDVEVLLEQFRVASARSDAFFLERILNFEHDQLQKTNFGLLEYLIPPEEKAKALALAMLSNKTKVFRVLLKSSSIPDADAWLDQVHPHSRCSCDSHRGSLLVRLVRTGLHSMSRAALAAGLDPNSQMCDGNTRRMLWHDFAPRNYVREPSKLEATFEKSTPLSSAAAINDVRMLDLLLDYGADPSFDNYAAFGVAARFGHQSFLERLLNIYSSRIVEAEDENFVAMQQASTVALKEASSAGQEATIDWILRRLQHAFEWDKPRPSSLRRRSNFRAVSLRRATAPTQQSQTSRKASLNLLRRHTAAEALSPSKQQVAVVLDKALDELIEEGIAPGASLRYPIAQGIALITKLQKSRFAEFAPQQLFRFYMQATSDMQMPTGEGIVSLLLDCGLGQYLAGVETTVCPTRSGRFSPTITEPDHRPSRDDGPETELEAAAQPESEEPTDEDSEDERCETERAAPARERRAVSRYQPHAGDASMQSRVHASLRVVAVVTGRLLHGVLSLSSSLASSSGADPGSDSSGGGGGFLGPFRPGPPRRRDSVGPVASDKERHSAIFTAVQRGHRAVLQLLLDLCNNNMVELLLTEAARYDQAEMAKILLEEIRARTARTEQKEADSDDESEGSGVALASSGVPNVSLRSAWRAALCVGNVEIADLLLEYGVSPTRSDVVDVLSVVCQSTDRAERISVSYVLEAQRTSDLLVPSDLASIFYEAVNDDEPSFSPLKDMLIHARFAFAEVRHLRRIMHRSCGKTTNENWRILTELCVKNMHLSDDSMDELNNELSRLLKEAETLPEVHVGVLTFLMHICEPPLDDEDDEEGRWL